MNDIPLIAAGILALAAAAIHGGAGEVLVVRKLSLETLPSTAFGGSRMTKAMIHVTWHLTTAAFIGAGVALLAAGTVLDGDAASAVARAGAAAVTAFAVVMLVLGLVDTGTPRSMLRHPAPLLFAAMAGLAWWGAA
jgi:hypothetical protein